MCSQTTPLVLRQLVGGLLYKAPCRFVRSAGRPRKQHLGNATEGSQPETVVETVQSVRLPGTAREVAVKSSWFYAVAAGRKPGVYESWTTCCEQVVSFPGAVHKKFNSRAAANHFVKQNRRRESTRRALADKVLLAQTKQKEPTRRALADKVLLAQTKQKEPTRRALADKVLLAQTKQKEPTRRALADKVLLAQTKQKEPTRRALADKVLLAQPEKKEGKVVEVYTDGCCTRNGRKGARGGIGVWWGKDHPDNLAERLIGRQTNSRAEITAAIRAIQQAKNRGLRSVRVVTDSEFLVKSVTSYMHKWLCNGFTNSGGSTVVNREDFERLLAVKQGIWVEWKHVNGHVGIRGNENADRLANAGAGPGRTNAKSSAKKLTFIQRRAASVKRRRCW